MKICVMGLGYIGLPTASLLATKGYEVLGVDISESVVNKINRGEIHIYEPDLDILVKSASGSGRLRASLFPDVSDVFIIAVPTPFKSDHAPDLAYVDAATDAICPFLKVGDLVILESTSPVGTTEMIAERIAVNRPDLFKDKKISDKVSGFQSIQIAYCPERVLPGKILQELVENDRIVGGINPESTKVASAFYKRFVNGAIVTTSARTAELSKLTENSYRDVNIAFANELSSICDKLNIDVWELISLANRHPRVKILQPGPGVGGHCIAVDPWFIVHSCPEESKLIKTARLVNDNKPFEVIKKVRAKAERLKKPKIACLGLSFKSNIDDLRHSPALEIVEHLAREKVGELLIAEPHIERLPPSLSNLENVYFMPPAKAIEEADILLLLVDHDEFKKIDHASLFEKIIIDTRGIWRQSHRV